MNIESGPLWRAKGSAARPGGQWQASRARLRFRMHTMLLSMDLLCILGGFFLAGLLYHPGSQPEQWLLTALVMMPFYVAVAFNGHAYSAEVLQDPSLGAKRAVQALLIAGGVFLLAAFYFKASDNFSRVTVALGGTISLSLLCCLRLAFLLKARRILGGNPYSVVLITDGGLHIPHDGFSLVIAADAGLDPSRDSPEMLDRLATMLSEADRVIVTCAPDRRAPWVKALKGANVRSEIHAPELEALAPLGMGSWNGTSTIVVADGPLGTFDLFVKRSFDLVVATAALIILSPLLLITAALIKFESAGPVFFVQTRIGQGNRMFRMLKFRSMRTEQLDGAGHTSTSRDDDRITRVGRIIRKTSIDELPQLINVLLGDMSIVGPRPHALGSRAEDKLFWEIDDRYWHRHAAKPGLTGLAQVRGFRGATLIESDLTHRLQADLEYLNGWSIWKDLKIILMTFGVLVHRNAF